jgi:iron(III) transport system permease protein
VGERILNGLAWVVAAVCIAPIVAAAVAAAAGDLATWRGLVETVLPRYVLNTLMLMALVAVGTAAVGTGAAWLVTMYRFPGSRILEVVLVLPLAFPAYVLAYAYTDFLSHPGPVQSLLREVTGWGPRDYWFPNIRSLPGAALMLVCVYYPYVYLLARTAFGQQSATAYLAARTLGQGPVGAFLRVSLPMARPAIAAGVLLAIMETIADYGTVSYFNVRTFSTGI